MTTNPEKYQAMGLGRTEDQLLLQSGNIDISTAEKITLLGVVLNSKLKFDDHVSSICRRVSAQVNARHRLKNILGIVISFVHTTKFLLLQPILAPWRKKKHYKNRKSE